MFLSSLLLLSLTTLGLVSGQNVVCPRAIRFEDTTRIQSADPVKKYNEISGLAISPKIQAPSGKRVVYGVNDGGGGNRLGVFDSGTGKRLLTFRIPTSIITNIDWETLTIGSCGSTGEDRTCIYIGDVGDNPARVSGGTNTRRSYSTAYRILKIKEPNYKNFPDNYELPLTRFSVLRYNYLDSSSPTKYSDCEAMFVDHTGWGGGAKGDLYVVTKWGALKSKTWNRVFRIPASAWPGEFDGSTSRMYSPKVVGRYREGTTRGIMGKVVTSAEMSLDGTVIALGTTEKAYLFLRCPGTSVEDALAAADTEPCYSWNHPVTGQVESFAWHPDGESTVVIPEGEDRRMGITMLDYDASKTSQACEQGPQVKWVCRSSQDDETFPDAVCRDSAENKDVCGQRRK